MKIGLYAGSFDPPTNGHLDIIQQTIGLFDQLYIAVGVNPDKRYMFSLEERVKLVQQMTRRWAYSGVTVIPFERKYLADLAKEFNVTHIVRGIRSAEDFEFEKKLTRFNTELGYTGKYVFLFPSTLNEHVSSSAVKGLIGYYGWHYGIERYLSDTTTTFMKEWYFKTTFKNLCYDLGIQHTQIDTWVDKLYTAYSSRAYHSVNHVLDSLELFKICGVKVEEPQAFQLAIYFHDYAGSVTESANAAVRFIKTHSSTHNPNSDLIADYVEHLIMATDYLEYEKTDWYQRNGLTYYQKLMQDIDLAVFYDPFGRWKNVHGQVRQEYSEYSDLEFFKGRKQILKFFRHRNPLYHTDYFKQFENKARTNLSTEIYGLYRLIEQEENTNV